MKIYEFSIIFCCCFLAISQCDAVAWKCEYKNEDFKYLSALASTLDYTCHLKSNNKNAVDVTDIAGQHEDGMTDDDLKILSIRSNLKTFSSFFCRKFKNLEMIRVKDVEIGSIDENSLQNCKNLEEVYLKGNKLRDIPENLFAKNSKLTHVKIFNNELTTLPENFFQNQNQLELLDLSFNEISFLPSKIFERLAELQHLDLSSNKLQVHDPEWFVNLKSLKDLYLLNNQISEVPGEIFRPLENLENLWLHRNRIKALSADSFEGLLNLKQLSLSGNEISELPRGVFAALKNLRMLSLASNKLSIIRSDSFDSHNLTLIVLSNNEIAALDEKIIDKTAVQNLDMTNNLCNNEFIKDRIEMKEKLQNCFKNYRERSTEKPIQSTVCGTSRTIEDRIIGGTQITRNAFPWIAALVRRANREFFCGGTLVTSHKVVTAAHCIHEKKANISISNKSFSVWLGIHDLKVTNEPGKIAVDVKTIHMHHGWDPYAEKYDADIAVLVLEQTVIFSRYIQPICLIEPTSTIVIEATDGMVVGFGKSEDRTKLHENIPKVINIPIHTNEDCFLKNSDLVRISSKKTFCGGSGNGTGVCNGDSGSGLFVQHDGVYYLRGIVSASLFTITRDCDVNNYAIYTDMLKFYDWVNAI